MLRKYTAKSIRSTRQCLPYCQSRHAGHQHLNHRRPWIVLSHSFSRLIGFRNKRDSPTTDFSPLRWGDAAGVNILIMQTEHESPLALRSTSAHYRLISTKFRSLVWHLPHETSNKPPPPRWRRRQDHRKCFVFAPHSRQTATHLSRHYGQVERPLRHYLRRHRIERRQGGFVSGSSRFSDTLLTRYGLFFEITRINSDSKKIILPCWEKSRRGETNLVEKSMPLVEFSPGHTLENGFNISSAPRPRFFPHHLTRTPPTRSLAQPRLT